MGRCANAFACVVLLVFSAACVLPGLLGGGGGLGPEHPAQPRDDSAAELAAEAEGDRISLGTDFSAAEGTPAPPQRARSAAERRAAAEAAEAREDSVSIRTVSAAASALPDDPEAEARPAPRPRGAPAAEGPPRTPAPPRAAPATPAPTPPPPSPATPAPGSPLMDTASADPPPLKVQSSPAPIVYPERTPEQEKEFQKARESNWASPFYDLSYTVGMPECFPNCYLPDLQWKSYGPPGKLRDQFGTLLQWDRSNWGKRRYPARVACMLGCGPHQQREREIIADTWGRHCDGLFFVFSQDRQDVQVREAGAANYKIMLVPMRRPDEKPGKKRTNYWEKIWRMWLKASRDIAEQYDWYYKGDTDTFCSIPNLRRFAQFHNPDEAFYFGHTHLARWRSENGPFNAGSGYVLSRGSLRRLGHVLSHIRTTQLPQSYPSHCVDRPGAGEDITFSFCLRAAGIVPANSLDHRLRQRFLVFQWKDHYYEMPYPTTNGKRVEGDYFWEGKPRQVGHLTQCCAREPITFHNYKASSREVFWSLERRFTANDSTPIRVPPPPQCFLYDEKVAPRGFDAHRNVQRPPIGQTIFTRPGELECQPPDWKYFTPTRPLT
eukprot:TRINITY_DN8266_c0_g1_i1.p1 TRINITY_DN8266_c0_g1~~TRINITY_DN8266_c0_g1_i1.p1  ORF type:complete len:643 (+),score=180.69 TRINITY_DN8266_c0_g1_i1:113-1930(+)